VYASLLFHFHPLYPFFFDYLLPSKSDTLKLVDSLPLFPLFLHELNPPVCHPPPRSTPGHPLVTARVFISFFHNTFTKRLLLCPPSSSGESVFLNCSPTRKILPFSAYFKPLDLPTRPHYGSPYLTRQRASFFLSKTQYPQSVALCN